MLSPKLLRPLLRRWRVWYLHRQAPNAYQRITEFGMPSRLLDRLLNQLASAPLPQQQTINAGRETTRSVDVLYVTSSLSPDTLKDAIALRRSGLSLTIVFSNAWGGDLLARTNDVGLARYNGLRELCCLMEGTEASVVIVRRGDPLQALLVACLFSGPLIYKPYDFVLRYPKEQLEERFWKNLDHLAEMAILGHASGIIHFHEQSVIDLIRKTYGYKRAVLRVPPGCVDDFRTDGSTPKLSSSDGQTHIVYASGLARQTSGTQRTNFDDQYHDFRRVLDQGFHLHLYIAYRRPQDTVRGLIRYFELADENPRFHIESSLPYQELVVDLAKYDYAYCHFPLLDSQILPEFHGALANNFFTYLDAGLPVICSPDTTAYASLVSRYGIGLVLENDGFADLRLRLRDVSYTDLVTNVSLMRTRLMHPAKELAAFVKDIASLAPEEQRHSV